MNPPFLGFYRGLPSMKTGKINKLRGLLSLKRGQVPCCVGKKAFLDCLLGPFLLDNAIDNGEVSGPLIVLSEQGHPFRGRKLRLASVIDAVFQGKRRYKGRPRCCIARHFR